METVRDSLFSAIEKNQLEIKSIREGHVATNKLVLELEYRLRLDRLENEKECLNINKKTLETVHRTFVSKDALKQTFNRYHAYIIGGGSIITILYSLFASGVLHVTTT